MKLFQYAILWEPTEQQIKDGKKATIVKDITSILAKDEAAVNMMAAREIPEQYLNELDQIKIAVVAF